MTGSVKGEDDYKIHLLKREIKVVGRRKGQLQGKVGKRREKRISENIGRTTQNKSGRLRVR